MSIPGFTADASVYKNVRKYRSGGQYTQGATALIVPTALHWGDLANTCVGTNGVRRYSAILWDIPWGQSWENTCAVTPGPAGTPVEGILPTRCVNTIFNIWGEWDVPDSTCCPRVCDYWRTSLFCSSYSYPSRVSCERNCENECQYRSTSGRSHCSSYSRQCTSWSSRCS